LSKLPVKSDPASLEAVIKEISSGSRSVSVPLSDRPPVYTDYQALGYTLLERVLRVMTPWEIGFAASMIKYSHPTEAQRRTAKKILKTYLDIDIDAGTVPSSGIVADNDDSPPVATRSAKKKAA
jgi:hypothetical protein